MSNYECTVCDFTTDHKANYDRHLQTTKHILKNTKTFDCKSCGKEFNSKQKRWNHQNYFCKKNKENSKDDIVKELLKKLDEKDNIIIEQLKISNDEKKDLMEIIKCSNKNAGKSMNTLAYVVKHYNKAPAMKKLSDKNAIKMLEYKGKELNSEEMMIHRYRNGTLDAYLGDIITNAFLDADNPSKQSLWTSDVARLCFVIMYPLSKGRREWITDKSGIKITELIIDPLLKNAREMLLVYIKEAGDLHNGTKILNEKSSQSFDSDDSDLESNESSYESSYDSYDDEDEKKPKVKYDKSRKYDQSLVLNMQTAHDIRMIIDNKELHKNVLRHICPFFKLNI